MFEPFQKFIPKAAQAQGISRQAKAADICQKFRNLTPEIFQNAQAINSIKPAFYKEGTLTINVENSAWGQEVIMRKTKIIEELNDKAGQEVIKKLKIQLSTSSNIG